MKTALLTLVFSVAFSAARASEDEGLFVPNRDVDTTYEIDDGEIVMRPGTERLTLTCAVFRQDTEDKTKYWLELDFTKWADPGDFYVFRIDGRNYQGFVVRGEGSNEGGGRWALGIRDSDIGRSLLLKIGKAYRLKAENVLDQTKGEQVDAPDISPRRSFDSR